MSLFGRPRKPAPYRTAVPLTQHEAFASPRPRSSADSPRRLRRRIAWVLGLAAALSVAAAVAVSPALAVRRIEVDGIAGLTRAEADAVLHAVALPAGVNMVRLRRSRLTRTLEALPFVAGARVSWRLPLTVRVTVQPRRPVAELCWADSRWQVDGAGVPIRTIGAPRGLPVIESTRLTTIAAGVPLADLETREAIGIVAQHGIPEGVGISKIVVDPAGELCLNMADGVTVQLGRVEGLREKLELVRRIYGADHAIATTVATISVRYPQAPVCVLRKSASDPSRAAGATASSDLRSHRSSSAVAP